MTEVVIDDRKKAVYNIIRTHIDQEFNSKRISGLNENKNFTLCVGAGISADIHNCLHKKRYLWNELVYGVADEVYRDQIVKENVVDTCIHGLPIEGSDRYEQNKLLQDLIAEQVKYISEKAKFLGTEDTMECVEYLKYLCYPTQEDLHDVISENVIALIIYDLFYGDLDDKSNKIIDVINTLSSAAYTDPNDETNYNAGNGKTIIELSRLILRMDKVKVLTYNYDDFLEMTIEKLSNKKADIFIVFDDETQRQPITYYKNKDMKIPDSPNITIHHVHGYVPHDWDRLHMNGELVFSENSYNHMSSETYNWTNRVQADTFLQDKVLFVGFSGVDTNFRRLMKQIKIGRTRLKDFPSQHMWYHVMFMGYNDIINNVCTTDFYNIGIGKGYSQDIIDRIAAEIVIKTIWAKDVYYKEQLGIEIIWYYNISEIADVLHYIQ